MDGVDCHDQILLSVPEILKSTFMVLLDLVIVNYYVTHVKCAKGHGKMPMTRAAYMTELHI